MKSRTRRSHRLVASLGALAVSCLTAGTAWPARAATHPDDSTAYTAGLLGNGQTLVALTPSQAAGASYVPDSNVLRLSDGQWTYLPEGATEPVTVAAGDPGVSAQIAASRAWLASGAVPGATATQRAASARALLSMRLLTQADGAVAAAWYGAWAYSWPRDSSFVAVAFARTGHLSDAYRILLYNARTQRADGTWDARTKLDGSGPPDARQWQLDANGWVPWSIWEWYQAADHGDRRRLLGALYPTVRRAADYAATSLDSRGLPPASPDYWEEATTAPNIGTAAPLLAGLHASADLARATGDQRDARAWEAAATRLSGAIQRYFAPYGYTRVIDGQDGRDSGVTFMAPPYNRAPADLAPALTQTYQALLRPNGGVIPGNDPSVTWTNSWMPETTFFALAWSGIGRRGAAENVMTWLLDHRDGLGELPEQINSAGQAASVVPLAWTDALVVLTLGQLDGALLPVPPG